MLFSDASDSTFGKEGEASGKGVGIAGVAFGLQESPKWIFRVKLLDEQFIRNREVKS